MVATTIVLAVKYYEEICIFSSRGERFFFDYEFAKAVKIPREYLVDFQFFFLNAVDHHLFISGEEYDAFLSRILASVGIQIPRAPQQEQ